MTLLEFSNKILRMARGKPKKEYDNMNMRVHIGNQLYDVKDIGAVIDMDTNKPNIVIHVDDK